MLKDFRKSRKQRKKEKLDQLAREMEAKLESKLEAKREASAKPEADAADGVEIEVYAAAMGLSTSQVWSLLRRGELLGRTEKGKLLVFARNANNSGLGESGKGVFDAPAMQNTTGDQQRVGATAKTPVDRLELPPLPADLHPGNEFEIEKRTTGASAADVPKNSAYLAVTENTALQPEISLLLDHLSLAKEENREIIKLTQDALAHVSTMTDTMIKMKDQLLGAKDEQLVSMREILAMRDLEIRKLKQEREDLEMLTRTLAEQK